MNRRTIVTIDEIRLHGFDARERFAIGDAVSTELSRVLRREPIGGWTHNVDRVDAGSFDLAAAMPARTVGARIASRVARGLRRSC